METKRGNNNRYFYLEVGEKINEELKLIAQVTIDAMGMMEDYHTVLYRTDDDDSFYVKEITEDEFLEHHKKENV